MFACVSPPLPAPIATALPCLIVFCVRALLGIQARKFRAERNLHISGFCLLLLFLINRLIAYVCLLQALTCTALKGVVCMCICVHVYLCAYVGTYVPAWLAIYLCSCACASARLCVIPSTFPSPLIRYARHMCERLLAAACATVSPSFCRGLSTRSPRFFPCDPLGHAQLYCGAGGLPQENLRQVGMSHWLYIVWKRPWSLSVGDSPALSASSAPSAFSVSTACYRGHPFSRSSFVTSFFPFLRSSFFFPFAAPGVSPHRSKCSC